jgi:uncharacterized protein YcfJ
MSIPTSAGVMDRLPTLKEAGTWAGGAGDGVKTGGGGGVVVVTGSGVFTGGSTGFAVHEERISTKTSIRLSHRQTRFFISSPLDKGIVDCLHS